MIAQRREVLPHHLEIVVHVALQALLDVVDGWQRPAGVLHLDYVAFVHAADHRLALMVNVIELDDLPALIDLVQQHVVLLVVQRRVVLVVQQAVDLEQLLLLMLVLVGEIKFRRRCQQVVMVRDVQFRQCVHVDASLRQVLHLKVLIDLHVGAVRRFRAGVRRTLGQIRRICDLIRRIG